MLEWALSSGALCALLILLRYVLRGRIGLRLQYALWGLALLRLLLPVSFGSSRVSVQNILPENALVFASASAPASPAPAAETRPGYPLPYTAAGEEASPYTPAAAGAALHRPAAPLDTARLLRLIWAAGAISVGIWMLFVNLRFALILRRSRRPLEADCPLPVYVSPAAETPCLFGLFRPAVYLPPEAAEDPALGHVLAHEYTHFRHADQVWSLLRCLALALHWYDPLVWWAALLSRRDGELACDEGTLRRLGEGEREEYGRTLIRMTAARKPALFRAATTMTGGKGSLRERIRLIAKKPKTAAVTLGAVLLIAALALGCTFTGAKQKGWDDERFIREAWTLAEPYGKARGLELDLFRRSIFRLTDGKTVEVYFAAGDVGAVEVTFTRDEKGNWTVREGTPGSVDLAFLDFVRNVPIEAALSLPHDGALVRASEWLHQRILDWNAGSPAGDGVYRAQVNKILKARIVGLTPLGTGYAGLAEGRDLYLLEYRLLPEDQEHIALSAGMRTEILDGQTWLTEWGENGQPYLLIGWKEPEEDLSGAETFSNLVRKTSWTLLEVTNTMEVFGVYSLSELAEDFAKNYTAISLERYMAEHQSPNAPEPTALPETLTGYSEYGSMTFHLDLDGWNEDFSYTVIWREGTAEPVLSPNRQLTRVGSTNRFILEYGVNLYLLDFDTGELRAFLPYEADGLRYADLEEQNKNQDNKARWASCPRVSPDGTLLLYQTERAPGGIRAYDFSTGLDRWLVRGFATAGGVVWTERDSVILRNYDDREGYGLYEVSLGDGSAVRLCGLGSPVWDGAWPWVYGASERSFLSLDLETGEIVATALEGEVTLLRANPAWPALAVLERVSGENQYRLLLYDPRTSQAQEVFRIADSASFREFRWTGENTLLLSEYAKGVTGTGSLVTVSVPVSLGDRMAECTARVDRSRLLSPAPETEGALTLNREDITLSGPGDAYMLAATLSPELTGREIIWTSQDRRVATVSRNGLVTAVNHGTTTITASVGETTAECVVRVMGYAQAEPESYSTIMENLTIFTLPGEGLSPEEAAYKLAELFLEDLEREDPGRTFRLTEYADLEVQVRPTLELDGETAAIYGLTPEECRGDMWLVDIRARFRYTGVISPIGPSEGDRWCDQLHQGSPVGFHLRLNENGVYLLQSRRIPQT